MSTSLRDLDDRVSTLEGGGGGGGAPSTASFVTIGAEASLSAERVLTGSSSVSLTDAGAGSTVTLAAITGTTAGTVCAGNDARLSDARAPTAHVHAAGDITSGTMATARLGSGTANATTFLRGDQTWAAPAGGSGASLEASIITATQANSTLTPAVLGTATFTIPAGKKAVISGNLIFTAAATTTGAFFGVTVTQPTGADGNATGSVTAYINITSAAAATGLNDGDVFNVAANATATVGTLSTATTAGNNPATLCCVIHNRSTNASTTVDVVFRSEVNASAVTAQIGSGATCVISS